LIFQANPKRYDVHAAVAGNWKFMTESGAVPASTVVNIDDVVDARFLPSR
jgi:hypothetical protein